MMKARITATGAYVPSRVVTNGQLAQVMDTSDEWIRTRTGIGSRHVAQGESTSHMAAKAAKDALRKSSCQAQELQFIIVATTTPDYYFPNMACLVQKEIGADKAFGLDVNAACSGFLYGLSVAKAYIESGMYQRGMVIGAEAMAKVVDWNDRSTCVLFGDGAGAVIVEAADKGIGSVVMGSDGAGGHVLVCQNAQIAGEDAGRQQLQYLAMDGQEVFRFAVKQVPAVVRELLDKEGLTARQLDYLVLHQANARIIAAVAKRLGLPEEKFPMNLEHYGNTSSASIPILLHEMSQAGQLKEGQRIVAAGFGAGLTWGGALIEW